MCGCSQRLGCFLGVCVLSAVPGAATVSLPILQPGQGWHCLPPCSPWASLAHSSLCGQAESRAERGLANHRLVEKCVSKA